MHEFNSSPAVSEKSAGVTGKISGVRIVIHPRCRHLIQEFEHYRFPEPDEGSMFPENPKKVNDHALDALRYLVAALKKQCRWEFL